MGSDSSGFQSGFHISSRASEVPLISSTIVYGALLDLAIYDPLLLWELKLKTLDISRKPLESSSVVRVRSSFSQW